MEKDKFDNLEEILDGFIEHVREAGVIVCDFQGHVNYPQKMRELVVKLQELDNMKDQFHNVIVPEEVFIKIDNGCNPQLYTRECVEKALAKNEQVKGQLDSLNRFRHLLINEVSQIFPREMAMYRKIKGESAVIVNPNQDHQTLTESQFVIHQK